MTKIRKAKIALLLDEPFFGTLLLGLNIQQNDNVTKTMATDGKSLFFNGAFVSELSHDELKTVLAHEVLHPAFLHHTRRGNRDAKQWNIAADYKVNEAIESANKEALAKGKAIPFPWPKICPPLLSDEFEGLSSEEVYGKLGQKPQDQQGQGQSQQGQGQQSASNGQGQQNGNGSDPSDDNDSMGDVLDAPANETVEQEAQWKVALTQAAQQAHKQGKLPASLRRLIDEVINPPRSWKEVLRDFIRERAKDDYSWSRPNPRYLGSGFILPSLYSQRLGKIAVIIDTSGSIEPEILNSFMAEVEAIAFECKPEAIILIDCDAAVNSKVEFGPDEPLPREFKGGGGTDFKPAFEALASDEPAAVIYFTDLDGSFPDAEIFPTVWAATSEKKAPWGVTVKL